MSNSYAALLGFIYLVLPLFWSLDVSFDRLVPLSLSNVDSLVWGLYSVLFARWELGECYMSSPFCIGLSATLSQGINLQTASDDETRSSTFGNESRRLWHCRPPATERLSTQRGGRRRLDKSGDRQKTTSLASSGKHRAEIVVSSFQPGT